MPPRELKRDALGSIRLLDDGPAPVIERDTRAARFGLAWLARRLAAREAAALLALQAVPLGVPRLVAFDGRVLRRSALPGEPLSAGAQPSREFFVRALRLVRAMHRAGVTHNDLAKEANWLRSPGDVPGLVDFQLAVRSHRRGTWFRYLAHEDLRHLLKHKRTYRPDDLTARQRRMLASLPWPTRWWRRAWKPAYVAVTRRALGWPERTGPRER
ncbi:MAG TPA: serine/threonine protein kinase [Gammaproteobacteria bacterium]|jgi:RIO-like serine/threonine protein kinase|nr:serine/threonine protein kinase [Gammaproteobacteria bacterium]